MSKMTQGTSKYVEDWLPIKSITNGMITTEDGYYVTGVKVYPRNIFILDNGTRTAILSNLANFYNTIDFEFWLLVADRPVDIDVYLSKLLTLYNQTQNAAVRKLITQDIDKANMFTSAAYNVVDTEYYFIFKEKKMDLVQKHINSLISGLASAGMRSAQVSNNDIRMILDNFLNDGDTTNFKAVI